MLAPNSVVYTELWLADRDRREAKIRFCLPFAISLPNAVAVRNLQIANIAQLTDAIVSRTMFSWVWTDPTPPSAGILSDTKRSGLLYYRNSERWEMFRIPSPKGGLFETTGPYAGIRLDRTNPAVEASLQALSTGLTQTVTPEGNEWPDEFIVGGLAI